LAKELLDVGNKTTQSISSVFIGALESWKKRLCEIPVSKTYRRNQTNVISQTIIDLSSLKSATER